MKIGLFFYICLSYVVKMTTVEIDVKELANFQVKRRVTDLYKTLFSIMEDLKDDGKITDAQYGKLRKRVLDAGNDTIRDLQKILEML